MDVDNVIVSPSSVVTVMVSDDDQYTFTFDPNTLTVAEGMSENTTLTISPTPIEQVSVDLSIEPEGSAELTPTSPIIFEAGQSTATATVMATDDDIQEDQESYTVSLDTGDLPVADKGELTVTIPANDEAPIDLAVTINADPLTLEIVEGQFDSFTLKVASLKQPATVILTVAAGLITDQLANQVVLNEQTTQAVVNVFADDNNQVDGDRDLTVSFALEMDVDNVIVSPSSVVTVKVSDNDQYTFAFDPNTLTVEEGMSENTTLTISPTPIEEVSVDLNVEPAGTDLTFTSPIIFEAGQSTAPSTKHCLLYTSPSPRDRQKSRMPSSA